MVEMWNAKNVYLLSVEVSNKLKDKYFQNDLPEMHDVGGRAWLAWVRSAARSERIA